MRHHGRTLYSEKRETPATLPGAGADRRGDRRPLTEKSRAATPARATARERFQDALMAESLRSPADDTLWRPLSPRYDEWKRMFQLRELAELARGEVRGSGTRPPAYHKSAASHRPADDRDARVLSVAQKIANIRNRGVTGLLSVRAVAAEPPAVISERTLYQWQSEDERVRRELKKRLEETPLT